MKILTSSPYAPFNAEEWQSFTKNCRTSNLSNQIYSKRKSLKKHYKRKSFKENIQKSKLVQLSFA
tara:strand:+ start:7258 stop:7452 length:195 start_codon:yes stop_codon:yes gene_type:complete